MTEIPGVGPEDKSRTPTLLQQKVDQMSKKVSQLMSMSERAVDRESVFNDMKSIGGYGFDNNIENLMLVANDPNKTQDQKEKAAEAEQIFALGTARALINGGLDDKKAIGVGSVLKIEERLPEELKGFGRNVRNAIIDEPKITNIVDSLDVVRKRTLKGGESGQKVLRNQIKEAQEKLILLNVDSTKEDQLGMVIEWLGDEIGEVDTERGELKELITSLINQKEPGMPTGEDMSLEEKKREQLAYVRGMLDIIESSDDPTGDISKAHLTIKLKEEIRSSEVHPEVAIEVRSRLKLHDCYVFMKKAAGYINAPESGANPQCPTVGMAANLAAGLNHALDSEAVGFLLKGDSNGIPVARAWDLYQKVNIEYFSILDEMGIPTNTKDLNVLVDNDRSLGTIEANYFSDGNLSRKKKVDEYIIDKLATEVGCDKSDASKAWSLAKKLSLATGEDSVFNESLGGNDEMAEDMYLRIYRGKRDKVGRPRGPQIHLDHIVGIGNSFLRRLSGVPLYDRNNPPYLLSKDVVVEPDPEKKLGIEEGSYVYHFGVWWTGKIHPLRNLLLDRRPDSKKILNIDFMQTAQDFFDKADPEPEPDDLEDSNKNREYQYLRYWWVVGVLDMATSIGELGWTQADISRFRQFLIEVPLSDNMAPSWKSKTFLRKEHWDHAMRQGNFAQKMLILDLKRIRRGLLSGVMGGSSSK